LVGLRSTTTFFHLLARTFRGENITATLPRAPPRAYRPFPISKETQTVSHLYFERAPAQAITHLSTAAHVVVENAGNVDLGRNDLVTQERQIRVNLGLAKPKTH
jgi:hypothetical protein